MRGLICPEPGQLNLVEDLAEPGSPRPGWVLLEILKVGICGTDYHIYEGTHPYLKYPRVMGHEISARVLESGEGVAIAPGTLVIVNPYLHCGECSACRKGRFNCCAKLEVLGVHCDGAMCERMLMPAGNLYPADGLNEVECATVEFLSIGAHAVRRSLAPAGSRALVIGTGPIGIGAAIFSRIAGHEVSLVDADAERLAFARDRLGFERTYQTSADLMGTIDRDTNGERFDVVFDATGNAASMQSAIDYAGQGGTLVLVGVVRENLSYADPELHRRELMVIASRNAVKADFDHVADSIRAGKVPVADLVTHTTSLEDAANNLPRWTKEKRGLIKAVIAIS